MPTSDKITEAALEDKENQAQMSLLLENKDTVVINPFFVPKKSRIKPFSSDDPKKFNGVNPDPSPHRIESIESHNFAASTPKSRTKISGQSFNSYSSAKLRCSMTAREREKLRLEEVLIKSEHCLMKTVLREIFCILFPQLEQKISSNFMTAD